MMYDIVGVTVADKCNTVRSNARQPRLGCQSPDHRGRDPFETTDERHYRGSLSPQMLDQFADDVDEPGPGRRPGDLNLIDQLRQRGKLVHEADRSGDRVDDRHRRERVHCTTGRMRAGGHAFRLPRRLLDHDVRAIPVAARTFKSGTLPNGPRPQALRKQIPWALVRRLIMPLTAD